MKNRAKIFFSLLGWILVVAACNPVNPDLGPILPKSSLKFSVTPLKSNPNKFVLKSETPGVTPYWVTPVGTSTSLVDTIDIAFPGTDTLYYSVEGPGGITTADPYILKITTIDPGFVSDTMWTDLTGGLGHSKTWVLDLDANGVSKYFAGPIFFGGLQPSPWTYDPQWSGATWVCPAADYGTMTFSLKGNVIFTSDNKQLSDASASGTGKFMLYPKTRELITYGAQIIHDAVQGARVKPSTNFLGRLKIQSISKNTLQLVVTGVDGTGQNNWLVYNYISLDYYNSH